MVKKRIVKNWTYWRAHYNGANPKDKWIRVADELREWKKLYTLLIKLRVFKIEDIRVLEIKVRQHINELSGEEK